VPGSVYHVFTNAIPDGTNSSIVRPSDWNSSHALTLNASGSEISRAFDNGGGITFGLETNGSITAAAPAGAPSPINFSAGTTSGNIGSVVFSNSNGISFGLNGSTITGTVKTDYLTTARASNDAVGLNTAKTAVTWTVNSSGISIDAGAYLTTARASNDAVGLNTAKTNVTWTVNSSGISIDAGGYAGTGFTTATTAGVAIVGTQNTAGLSLGVPAMLTTAALSTMGLYASSNTYLTSSGTHDARSLSFRGDKNITVGISASEVVFSVGNYLTTARGSTDAVGLNTAQTNVTWTVNSSGISINAGGYAGTGFTSTTTAGTDIKATNNTAGLSMAVPAYLTTSVAQTNQTIGLYALGNTTQNSSTTLDARTVSLNGLGAMTVGYSGGSVQLSAPATSSLVGTSGISVSSNGSTISVQPVPMSAWDNAQNGEITQAGTVMGNSLVSIRPFRLHWPLAVSNIRVAASIDVATVANTSSAYIDVSMSGVVYSRNASTLSSMFSFSNSLTQLWQSNSTGSVTGVAALTATFPATTLTPGDYWMALHMSTANSATAGANTTALGNSLSMVLIEPLNSAPMLMRQWGNNQTANSQGLISGIGIISTGATRATIAFSDYTVTGTRGALANIYVGLRNDTYQA
jgi:hypothetical protein